VSGHQYNNKRLQMVEGMKNGKDEYKEVKEKWEMI
jgi:hypothetical protein